MIRDPETGRLYVKAAELRGFHTRRGVPSVHLVGRGATALCGRLAETLIGPAELPPCPDGGFCQACLERVWGGAPALIRWHKTHRAQEGDDGK